MKKSDNKPSRAAAATVDKQRRIQQEQDSRDAKEPQNTQGKKHSAKTMPPTGHGNPQPVPPMSAQHLEKPGL